MPLQPSKLKSLLSRYLATNSFGLGILFTNQFASSKILGTMATKMVATWRVDILYFIFKLGVWGQDCLSAVAKKQR